MSLRCVWIGRERWELENVLLRASELQWTLFASKPISLCPHDGLSDPKSPKCQRPKFFHRLVMIESYERVSLCKLMDLCILY